MDAVSEASTVADDDGLSINNLSSSGHRSQDEEEEEALVSIIVPPTLVEVKVHSLPIMTEEYDMSAGSSQREVERLTSEVDYLEKLMKTKDERIKSLQAGEMEYLQKIDKLEKQLNAARLSGDVLLNESKRASPSSPNLSTAARVGDSLSPSTSNKSESQNSVSTGELAERMNQHYRDRETNNLLLAMAPVVGAYKSVVNLANQIDPSITGLGENQSSGPDDISGSKNVKSPVQHWAKKFMGKTEK